MLTVDMNRSFLLKAHSLDRTDIKDTQTYDVLFYLNQAQNVLTDKLITERRFDLLRPITVQQTVLHAAFVTSTYDCGINGAEVVDLAALTTYRTFLRSQSKTTRTATPAGIDILMANKPIGKEELFKWETNGTNKPIFTNPKEILEGKYLVVLPDAYSTITSIDVIYVRIPSTLVLTTPATDTCELPEFLHQTIVDLAVQISGETVNVNDLKK